MFDHFLYSIFEFNVSLFYNFQETLEEMNDAEKAFDDQFKNWESQFIKWKEQNINHPDKVRLNHLLISLCVGWSIAKIGDFVG